MRYPKEEVLEWIGSAGRRANLSLFPLMIGAFRFERDVRALSDLIGCDGDDRLKKCILQMLIELYQHMDW